MGLKIVIEQEEEMESEDCQCPKCGAECESEDKYCAECGSKLPVASNTPAKARLNAMQKMTGPMEAED